MMVVKLLLLAITIAITKGNNVEIVSKETEDRAAKNAFEETLRHTRPTYCYTEQDCPDPNQVCSREPHSTYGQVLLHGWIGCIAMHPHAPLSTHLI